MKKMIAMLLTVIIVLSIAACGSESNQNASSNALSGKETEGSTEVSSDKETVEVPEQSEDDSEIVAEPTVTYSLGDTVSTDIMDFTLLEASLSYYADRWASPLESKDDDQFNPYSPAKVGQCMVCMTFSVKNNDRSNLAPSTTNGNWKWNFTVTYNGEIYKVSGWPDEDHYINQAKVIRSRDGGKLWTKSDDNILMDAGDEWYFRAIGYSEVFLCSLCTKYIRRCCLTCRFNGTDYSCSWKLILNLPFLKIRPSNSAS